MKHEFTLVKHDTCEGCVFCAGEDVCIEPLTLNCTEDTIWVVDDTRIHTMDLRSTKGIMVNIENDISVIVGKHTVDLQRRIDQLQRRIDQLEILLAASEKRENTARHKLEGMMKIMNGEKQ